MTDLFKDSAAEAEKRIDRLIEHFRHAEYLFFLRSPRGLPTPRDLLWLLLEDAMHTSRNVPDEERRVISRVGTVMPSTRTTDNETYNVELSRLLDGMSQYDAKEVRSTVHQGAVDRMVDVLDLLRFVKAGRAGQDALRLKRTVLARAAGLSIEQCGRIWDRRRLAFDRRAMHDLKERVLGQVLLGIEEHFHLQRTSRGFRRMTVREIERRRNLRKRLEQQAAAEHADAG